MLLQRKLFYLLPNSALRITTLAPFSDHVLIIFRHFSTSTNQTPSPKHPFIVEFLLNSCGLSSSKAIEASKYLAHLKSLARPNSVIQFLQQLGFSDSQIGNTISKSPNLLCAKVEKTLRPKIISLQEIGFSEAGLVQLISANPNVLRYRNLRPKIEFWRGFFRSDEVLFKAMERDGYLLSCSLSKRIIPNISLVRECGIPDHRIAKMILSARFVGRKPSQIQAAVKRADELGVPRSSGLFGHLLLSVFSISQSTVDAKLKLFKSLGWSEAEFLSAIPKNPVLLRLSEKNIRDKMDFFMKEVGCGLGYIVYRPVLLSYSLERRLIPRYLVLRILKHEGLPEGTHDLLGAILLSEKSFIEKFVLPYKENVLGLHEAYAGKAPI